MAFGLSLLRLAQLQSCHSVAAEKPTHYFLVGWTIIKKGSAISYTSCGFQTGDYGQGSAALQGF